MRHLQERRQRKLSKREMENISLQRKLKLQSMSDNILFDQFAKGKKQFEVKTNNCVIYTRVSTKEQADNNMSLESQRKMCEQLSQKSKFTILGCFGGTYE